MYEIHNVDVSPDIDQSGEKELMIDIKNHKETEYAQSDFDRAKNAHACERASWDMKWGCQPILCLKDADHSVFKILTTWMHL